MKKQDAWPKVAQLDTSKLKGQNLRLIEFLLIQGNTIHLYSKEIKKFSVNHLNTRMAEIKKLLENTELELASNRVKVESKNRTVNSYYFVKRTISSKPKQADLSTVISEISLTEATPKATIKTESITDSYKGGKNASGTYQFLINHVPPVQTIISGFLGHCGLIKNIKPAAKIIGIDKDKNVIDRWQKDRPDVILVNGDFLQNLDWINPIKFGKTVVFLDPPYLNDTRKNQTKLYDNEFETLESHKKLLEKAVKFPCYVMITAYENELYDSFLLKRGFKKYLFNGQTRGGRRQEAMYINYEPPTELHDYSFVGSDYRERWNNTKLLNRKLKDLEEMPLLRRNMIIDSIVSKYVKV